MCVYHCAKLSYTTQHKTVMIIFPLILQTSIIIAQMMSTAGAKHGEVAPTFSKTVRLGDTSPIDRFAQVTCSPRPPTFSKRHVDLHVWSYPRHSYILHQVSLKSVQGCLSPWGVEICPFRLVWLLAFTAACTTVQAVIYWFVENTNLDLVTNYTGLLRSPRAFPRFIALT